jgi:hypothetical protein
MHVNDDGGSTVGTAAWVERTAGRLTAGERRGLLGPLARTHLRNTVGRLRLATGLHPGRTAYVPPARLAPPDTVLTRAARDRVQGWLPAPLLNHSHRAYLFGRALGELEGLEVDSELLFAAALLHDTGLVAPPPAADFTLASAQVARQVAETIGLSAEATETVLTAITLHYNPGVTAAAGPVAYLLAAGTAVDVVGFRSWELPTATITDTIAQHPRSGFKRVFADAFRQEARRMPEGRAQFLHRYGAFAAAVKLAPYAE